MLLASATYAVQAQDRGGDRGELAQGDEQLGSGEFYDAYTFEGRAGERVELQLQSGDFDTYLMVRGPGGVSLDNDDLADGDTNSEIVATLTQSGRYRVLVTSYAPGETGGYSLRTSGVQLAAAAAGGSSFIERVSGVSASPLAVGAEQSGSLSARDAQLENGEYFDNWSIEGRPGERLVVEMESDALDTYLVAFDGADYVVENDDDPRRGTNSRVEVTLPAAGRLTIAATSYQGGETGAYSIIARRVGDFAEIDRSGGKTRIIELGGNAQGQLDTNSEHSYLMQVDAGHPLLLALTSTDFDPILRVEGPDGFSAENDDESSGRSLNSLIETELLGPGTYRITVASYGGEGAGTYRLAARDADNPIPPGTAVGALEMGSPVTAMLDSDDALSLTGEFVDYYRFTGHRGQRLTFDLESEEFDTLLTLHLPDGREETNDDRGGIEDTNSRLSITLPEDGTYQLQATSFATGMQGRYSLAVTTADPSVRTVRPTGQGSRVFALNVGVSDYDRIDDLPNTDEDALRLSQALEEAGILAPESVTLVNADATRANFQKAFSSITAAMGPDDLLMVFFSGHGDKVEGVDTEMDGSAETIELYDAAFYDYELEEMFRNVDARTLLVIDSCFSGGFDNVVRDHVDRMGIFSSDEDVLSLVADKYQAGGYIAYLMQQALQGGADADGNHAITAGELSEYMRRGFYSIALEKPLETDVEDFRNQQSLAWQHIVIDRGGDGMPFDQVLMNLNQGPRRTVARAD